MIKAAGLGVAMGNSVPELFEICGMKTKPVAEDGLALALGEIFSL
jgi:hydroxymethylpyrimidine pyrophosphatase-like HAD family hydrolase